MKKYLGVKIIQAEICKGFNNKAFNENDCYPTDAVFQEGYKVIYPDGYMSWSPKDVFEKAYKEIGVVADEKEERAILVNPSTGIWHVVGNVAKIEL